MAWRNLLKNKRRHFLSGTALAFGFCGLVLLGGYMLRMDKYLAVQTIYLNHTGHISIYKSGGLDRHLSSPLKHNLSMNERTMIEEILKADVDAIEFVGATLKGAGLITNGCTSAPVFITALDSDFQKWIRTHPQVKAHIPELGEVKRGEGFWQRSAENNPVNISPTLANRLGKSKVAGDFTAPPASRILDCQALDRREKLLSDPYLQVVSTSFYGGVAAIDAEVAGHTTTGLSLKDHTSLSMPLSSAQSFFQTDMVTSLSVFLKPHVSPKAYFRKLEESLKAKGLSVDLYLYKDERVSQYYVGAMNFVRVMVIFFLFLVCGVVLLSILNALNISLLERKTEIATLRAIGFRPLSITQIFLRENLLLGLFSFAGGGLMAFIIKVVINSAGLRFTVPGLADDLQFMLRPGFGFSLGLFVVLVVVVELATLIGCLKYMKQKITLLLGAT